MIHSVPDGRIVSITGVTGSQGGAAARHLLAAGWHVRGLTRNPDSASAIRARHAGIELVKGDMSDSAALDRLVSGAQAVYAVTDFFHNGLEREVEQGKGIADAARRAGVSHFVFPSLALAEQTTGVPYFEAKAAIERHITSAALPATIIRPAMFMEDLVDSKYAPPMWWGSFKRTVGARKKVYWIAVDDLGAIVARIAGDPAAHVGRAYALAGDCRTIAEAGELFKRVTGKRPLAIPAPNWVIRRVVNADLVPMWEWLGRNAFSIDLEAARRLLPEIKDMERWLRARNTASSGGESSR